MNSTYASHLKGKMARFWSLTLLMAIGATVWVASPATASTDAAEPAAAVTETRDAASDSSASVPVSIIQADGAYQLIRGGQPYFIKGVGGSSYLAEAAAAGANAIRTWGAHDAGLILDQADRYHMTVMLGIWMSQSAVDYLDPGYRARKVEEVRQLVTAYRDHPALLMWSIGNEINLSGGGTPAAWQFVDELAAMIKNLDANHPVISVIAYDDDTLNVIADHAPQLDAVGINAYGAIESVRAMIESSRFKGPYIVTEWGVDGHWEAQLTVWGRPIEPPSARKASFHLDRYNRDIIANRDRCLGSYVFLWGQKQERTPTWYSMFIETLPGEPIATMACPTVDVMRFNWSGSWPVNRAPDVEQLTIDDISADGDVRLDAGRAFIARVAASDPDNDGLRFVWEIMEEPTVLGNGGSAEPRPQVRGSVVTTDRPELDLAAPAEAGDYRLFVYVLDKNGHAGTANIPFQVAPTIPGNPPEVMPGEAPVEVPADASELASASVKQAL